MATPRKTIPKRLTTWLNIVLRVALLLFLIILGRAVYKGLHQDDYVIQAIQVPKEFKDNGFSGEVVASRIQDRILAIKRQANSTRGDSTQVSANRAINNINLQVLGVGVSSNSIIQQLRDILGVETKIISGDLTQLGDHLSMTLRMPTGKTMHIEKPYAAHSIKEDFEEVVEDAAIFVLTQLDPYFVAVRYYREGEVEKSEQLIRDVLIKSPQDAKWAYLLWGNIKNDQDKPDVALRMYHEALSIDPDFSTVHRTLGWHYWNKNNLESAKHHFEAALREDPDHFGTNNGIAMTHMRLGQPDIAKKYYEHNITIAPERIWSYGNYATALLQYQRDTAQAVKVFDRAAKAIKIKDDNYYVSLAGQYYFLGMPDTALTFVEAAIEHNPNSIPGLQYYLSYHNSIQSDAQTVLPFADRYYHLLSQSAYDGHMKASAANSLAMTHYRLGQIDSMQYYAHKAVDWLPTWPLPYTTLGESYFEKGNKEEFYNNIQKAVDLGLEFNERWWDSPPYNQLKNDKRLLSILKPTKIKG